MKIELKCFADLAKYHACDYAESSAIEVPEGARAGDVMRTAGIPQQEVKMVFVNGKIQGPDHLLKDGDRMALAPATGGM